MKNFFEKWHPKVALRYLPIVEEIKKSKITKTPEVLEVGSGPLGIAPYLKMPVTGVDIKFDGPKFPLLKQVFAKATNLPFEDQSFDFVVLVDLLEHLPRADRPVAIRQALRCARKGVFIAVPAGVGARKQDNFLNLKYQQVFGVPFAFLSEHEKYQLPEKTFINDTIIKEARNLGRKTTIKTQGNINLKVRQFLMWGFISKSLTVNFIFRYVFLLFIPVLRRLNQEPTYRQMFFVKLK